MFLMPCGHLNTCPKQEVSGNTSGKFVIRTDFLPYILRISVSGYFLSGTSNTVVYWEVLLVLVSWCLVCDEAYGFERCLWC